MPAVAGLRSSPRASSPGGSARLTAWRLFIHRQRQPELLADADAFVLQGSLPPISLQPLFPPPHPDAASKPREVLGGCPSPDAQCATAGLVTRPQTAATHPQHPLGITPHPLGEEGGHPTLGSATQHCASRGGEHLRNVAPLGRYQEKRWHRDKVLPPSTSGKGTIPGHFFFWQALGAPCSAPPPPSSSSRARARGYN